MNGRQDVTEQVASRSAIASLGIKGAPGGTHRTAVAAFGCSEDGPCVRSSPAEIGEHTEEIIVGLGYSPELVEDLRRRGVV
jgi:crotonobetainyl-CoA:carnitine CoA-transferase CaiB-like acyl-CoA transferase